MLDCVTILEGASTLDKLIVICLSVCELSLLIGPFLVILLELHSPCAPPFIGSLSPYCSARVWTEPPILVRSTWMLAEVWFWQQTTYDGTLYIMYALIVPIGGMLDYLQYFQRSVTQCINFLMCTVNKRSRVSKYFKKNLPK